MAKPEEDREKEIWGTWEELLLACAVNRHGTKNWDSVAMEIRTRSSAPHFLLTPLNCKQKYHDLHGRFAAQDDKIDDTENESEHKIDDKIPWLEELRKRRVAELKREVERYDVSIVSLQLEVKRLKEERERSEREKEDSDVKPDLEKESEEDQKQEREDKPARSSPASIEGNPVSSEESGRENQSFNESNSTDQKADNREAGVHESEKEQEPKPESESVPGSSKTAAGEPDPVSANSPVDKLVAEGSYNGSSDTVAKDSTIPAVPTRKAGDSPELWESVAESKGGEDEGAKENSDVQSSASLSKKNRRKKEVSASSSGDEPETEEVSPAIERASVESEPLMSVLEIIKSHKHGSLFERRLESQDTAQYKTLIRQHLDLKMVETRLKEGWYSGCSNKFFRDILLLFNNAIVFFPNNSTEFAAAIELRDLVSKQITPTTPLSTQQPEEPTPPSTAPLPSIPKPDPEPSDSLLAKQKSSGPMIVCRKRSSIAAKASTEKKGEQKGAPVEPKKPVVDRKQQPDNASKTQNVVEEQSVLNKRKSDGSVSGTRSSRSNTKNRNNANNPTKNSNLNNAQNPSSSTNLSSGPKGQTADDSSDTKADKEKKNNNNNSNVTTVAKKRSMANFLNRMKRNSSSNNGTLLETLKSSGNSNTTSGKGGGGATEQKRGGGRSTAEGRKEHGSRQSSSAKQAQEQSSPAKRSVGRPPKRSSAAPPAPSKRTRETVETETVPSRQPRKRSRR